MRAALLAIGSELLGEERLDTNSLRLAKVLRRHGVAVGWKGVVGDDEGEIAGEIRRLLDAFEVVIVGGGLGPTSDDLTREAAARALGRGLSHSPAIAERIAARFAAIGRTMAAVNLQQAQVIDGATVLENAWGTAPGQLIEKRRDDGPPHCLFLFPAVPHELEKMTDRHLEPWLAARCGDAGAVETRTMRVACLPEATVEERVAPAYADFGRDDITLLAANGDVLLRVTARGERAVRAERLDRMAARLVELVGTALYSHEEARTLEVVVGELLREHGLSFGTAESCTGGLLAERITRVPGSSDFFRGSVVAYDNSLKSALLGVPAELVATAGAVSEEVATAMARGARERLGVDLALAVTGIAGPGGGTPEKPAGTVHIALASAPESGAEMTHRRLRLPGDRERVRWLSSHVGLELVRRHLLHSAADAESHLALESAGGHR